MLWVLIFGGITLAILFFIILLSDCFSDDRDEEIIHGGLIFIAICILASLVGYGGIKGIDMLSYTEVEQTNSFELVSLSDDSQVSVRKSGAYCYIIAVETKEVYSFYYKVNDNGFARKTVNANDTIIYEQENGTPCVIEYTTYTKNKMNGILRTILAFGYGGERQKNSYEIYVPKGTIVRTFELDTQ